MTGCTCTFGDRFQAGSLTVSRRATDPDCPKHGACVCVMHMIHDDPKAREFMDLVETCPVHGRTGRPETWARLDEVKQRRTTDERPDGNR